MLLSRHLLTAVLFLVACTMAMQAAAATAVVSLLPDDQRCLYTSTPVQECTPLRSCRTCLNADLANPTCFLDARGLCRAMSSYNSTAGASGSVRLLVAANTTYCPASDATCTQCLSAKPASGVCTGADGDCVCVAACEKATWQDDVKSMIRASAASAASSVTSPSVVVASSDASHTSPAVVAVGIIACAAVALLLVNTVRRRWIKRQEPSTFDGYNIALTPTTKLPSKTVDVRV